MEQRPTPKKTPLTIPQEELEFTFARSSGAGGQNVNKVNSKAILRWNPGRSSVLIGAWRERFMAAFGGKLTGEGDLVIMSDRHRDQGKNASDCLDKLREMLSSVRTPPKKRKATKPTYGSKMRRLDGKRAHKEKKQNRRKFDD